MATDEKISAVSNIENARKSDGTSTAGEHNVDKVEEQSKENTKRDTDEIENDKGKTNNSKEDENKKIKIFEQSNEETNPEELIIV